MELLARRDLELSLRDAERRAYEAEAAYETLRKQVPGAIYAYAPEVGGPTLSMSAYVEELLGVPAERFLSGDGVWDELLHPVVIGKRMFDVGFEPWGDPPPFGMPVFIVSHEQREPLPMQGGTTYTFVTDGIEAALELARAAAGDKNVGIWGGANIIREYLRAGSLDEMQIHLIPVLLDGTRLFEDLGPGTDRTEEDEFDRDSPASTCA